MLSFRVFVKLHHRSATSPLRASSLRNLCSLCDSALDLSYLLSASFMSPKSFPLNSFADPHPLNPVPSILYKNIGGRGRLKSPIFRIHFQVPHPVSPAFATLTKTAGVWGYSSHSGTLHASSTFKGSDVQTFQRISNLSPFLSSSCALFCTCASLNFFVFKRFRTLRQKNTRGGGYPTLQPSNLPTFKRSSRPIAAKRLWCNNPQRRENSSPSGETTPLPPVSKDSERTSGTARSR